MSYSFSFELNELPPSLNVYMRLHWAARNKIFHHFKHKTWCEIKECPPLRPLTSYKIVCTRHTIRPLDPFDNLPGSFKAIIDALVTFRVIEDDKWTMADQISCKQVKVKTKKEQKITVMVQSV